MRGSGRERPGGLDDRYDACLGGQCHCIIERTVARDIWGYIEDCQGRKLPVDILTEEKAFPDFE